MNSCQQCGEALPPEAAVCPQCGMAVTGTAAASSFPSIASVSLPKELELVVSTRPLSQPGAAGRALLLVVEGGTPGREFPVTQEEALIGRWDPDCGSFPQIDLSDEDTEAKVSRKHARILQRQGKYFLEDLGSRNGTYLNRAQRLRLVPNQPHPLNDGDEILIGKLLLKFSLGGYAPPA